ncbi:sporulation protein YunB [Bacillus oleivorans]|uniref:Sporulation protein YunB n=1 Tax=Bacillus oleivorans TaxID=1448271 RepID=A0A285D7M5_9BACI|nr:sporulation protein YunB [Bacillus oleivorans]SNX75278.1 sporulation protein YunB [Bacillus oleivorans]
MSLLRGKKPRRGPLPFRHVFIITFIFFIVTTSISFWLIDKGLTPTLLSYAELKTKQIGTAVINKAVNKKIADSIELNNMVEQQESSKTLNLEIANRIGTEITSLIQTNLNAAESGDLQSLQSLTDVEIEFEESSTSEGIVFLVPLGQATNNTLFGNLGPKIPIRFYATGNVVSEVKFKTEEYGINNATHLVYLDLAVDIQIIMPFQTKVTTIKQEVPIGWTTDPGDVPQFYGPSNGDGTSPSIELPVEP